MGSPALIRVRNCWLKITNWLCRTFRPAELNLAPGKQAPRLYPIDQVTLLHKALADLGFRVTMLHLLRQMAAIVSDFYQKLGHVLVVLPLFASQV